MGAEAVIVKLICAGDVLHSDFVSKQPKILQDNREVALVAVWTDHIADGGKLLTSACGLVGLVGRHSGRRAIRRIVFSSANPVGPPVSGLFRRADFGARGGCQEDLAVSDGHGLMGPSTERGEFLGITATLAASRIGGGSMMKMVRRSACNTSVKGGCTKTNQDTIHRRRGRWPLPGSAGSASAGIRHRPYRGIAGRRQEGKR
jgi:hypothetical protein